MLKVITCYFNPTKAVRPYLNAQRFFAALPRRCHIIELVFEGDEPEIKHADQVFYAGPQHLMWQKEKLIQVAIDSLPAEVTDVAVVDADFLFANPYVLEETERLLEQFPVVHMCENLHHTDRKARVVRTGKMLGARFLHNLDPTKQWFHTGGCWAAHRLVMRESLFTWDVLGGGDSAASLAWCGEQQRNYPYRKYCQEWYDFYVDWAEYVQSLVNGNIGCVTGDAFHLWHGDPVNRRYVARHCEVSEKYNLNPLVDVREDANGIWEFCTDKPEMHAAIRDYFINRKVDG